MPRHFRRRSRWRYGFGFVLLLGAAVGAAWKLGWFPVQFGEVATGLLLRNEPGDSDERPDQNDRSISDPFASERRVVASKQGLGTETVAIDPIVFEAQTEPLPHQSRPEAMPERRIAQNPGLSQMGSVQEPSRNPAVLPPSLRRTSRPTDAAETAQSRAGPWISPGSIQQVANQVEQQTAVASSARPTSGDHSESAVATSLDLSALDRLIEAGDDVTAHRELSEIYWNQPALRPRIQTRLDTTARRIYFLPDRHYMDPYVVQPSDQLRNIAKRYDVTWEYLAKLNRVDPRRIQAGQKLKVIKGPFAILIDLSDFELTVHAHGYFVHTYRVGIGRNGATPIGTFRVLNKVINPQYTDPEGRVIAADDPANPLGERWIDIGGGFGIHGTIDAGSIGQAKSRGCIRMRNTEVAELYDLLTIGSEVVIQR